MRNRASDVYRLCIRALPVLFVAGFVTGLVGGYLRSRAVWNAGGAIFLFGGAVWGLANGGFLALSYVRAQRRPDPDSFVKGVAADSLKPALVILLAIFLIAAGIGLSCAAWKVAFG